MKNDSYHFHRDCRYYGQCKEEMISEGKREYIKLVCPRLKKIQKYYPKDLHTTIRLSKSSYRHSKRPEYRIFADG